MATHDFKFTFDGEKDKLVQLIGTNKKLIMHFVGHEDFLHKFGKFNVFFELYFLVNKKKLTTKSHFRRS